MTTPSNTSSTTSHRARRAKSAQNQARLLVQDLAWPTTALCFGLALLFRDTLPYSSWVFSVDGIITLIGLVLAVWRTFIRWAGLEIRQVVYKTIYVDRDDVVVRRAPSAESAEVERP